ncbi:MAG TPA: GntR family transcriptional regulator [Candidatus Avidesulfovibrio excrementigallinarum]|nr:GntR family transcriptional regulator [Candidatus Avidesulfovibrio excrementigallinarum]
MPELYWSEFGWASEESGEKELTLATTAYNKLINMFISLEIRPGSLLQERQLADSLNMSRTPLREALTRLCHESWLTINSRRNVVVRPVTLTTVREVFEVREMLELRGVDRVISDDAIHASFVNLTLVHDTMANMHVDDFNYILVNQKFHAYLSTIDHNSLILGLWKRMHLENIRLAMLALSSTPQRKKAVHNEHLAIIEMLLKRDREGARRNLLAHLRTIRANLEKALGRSALLKSEDDRQLPASR